MKFFFEIYQLDCILTTIFPIKLVVLLVKRQYSARFFLPTGKIFSCGFLSPNSWTTFCFRKLTGLVECTGIFIFTILSSLNPILTSFFVSMQTNRRCRFFPLLFRRFYESNTTFHSKICFFILKFTVLKFLYTAAIVVFFLPRHIR